ncbi:helix-turn-helix transcriptional regulator [Nocardioides sp. KC13]|uniref:Helix-turn-helix transcriptional regulator n=1 Tax=Nocardioides turkmenicus TaxID=2711220 RepID=A0A6M1R8L6_9ACTN|nr:TetR family transcriptional regulator [Nocardioides sp. KC13]NGN93918.1 helix-turn-helix transcriptional regulator [Nocardioides sp. KC13]
MSSFSRVRPGRPRLVPDIGVGTPREQVLEAAARLFTSKGFAATSTREIAEAVGIRQASLYYHFAGKDEILAALLATTVRPTQVVVEEIVALVPPERVETALCLLALVDIDTLARVPHNVGVLYQLPDVVSATNLDYASFRQAHSELTEAYANLGSRVAERYGVSTSPPALGSMLIQQVEGVITLRTDGKAVDSDRATEIAAGCLRLCGCDRAEVDESIRRAKALHEQLTPRTTQSVMSPG